MSHFRLQITISFLSLGIFLVHGQSYLPTQNAIFKQSSYKLKERIRAIDVVPGKQKQNILLLTRRGNYPEWKYTLQLLELKQRKWVLLFEKNIPQSVLYYSVINLPNQATGLMLWNDEKIELNISENEQWKNPLVLQWLNDKSKKKNTLRKSDPSYTSLLQTKANSEILVLIDGMFKRFSVENNQIQHQLDYQPKLPVYVSNSRHALALELQFAAKSSAYYPNIKLGEYQGEQALFLSWLDQVDVFSWNTAKHLKHFNFNHLTENERDSGQAVSSVKLVDLNDDQHMDYVLNISLGSPTQMKSRSSIHYGQANGEVDLKGIKFKSDSDRASGLIAYDLNKDNSYEFVSASGQFSLWSIIKALTKGQVDITFSIYDSQSKAQKFSKPLSQKKLTFGFNLSDLNLEGILPDIDHDFNGDGLNDVFYAQNNRKLSVILQKKNKEKHFSNQAVGTYEVNIPKYYRLGDFNGDQKTDAILFSTKPKKNKVITTLLNNL